MKRCAYGAVLAAALASVVFAASAVAGNPHGSSRGQQKARVQAHLTVTAHARGHAHANTSGGGGVNATTGAGVHGVTHGNAHAVVHGNAHAVTHANSTVGSHTQTSLHAGLKPSAPTGFNTVVSASSGQTKLYGNGMTAGQIAALSGNGGVMLFGPDNSQAHLLLCGAQVFDVHALKAHANACTTVVGGTSPSTSSSLTVTSGIKPSFMTGFNVVVPASSNQTKLYGNGMTAGQIALQAGLGGAMLFGPGNRQAHKVLCGSHVIDVHAL